MTCFQKLIVVGLIGVAGMSVLSAAPQPTTAQGPAFVGQAPQPEPVVKGAPYSGEGITTVKAAMFDGTRIERSVTAKIYRDSAGRVRREQTVMGLEALDPATDVRAMVTIVDPVADVLYTLIPGSRTAQRMSLAVLRGAPAPPPAAAIGGSKEQPLGTRDIDGIMAVGRRTITTIPAGRVGNDKPIEIIEERWDSPDLKVLVRSLYSDPRSGEIEYRLTKISRAEPPASLFQVPAGYTIADVPIVK